MIIFAIIQNLVDRAKTAQKTSLSEFHCDHMTCSNLLITLRMLESYMMFLLSRLGNMGELIWLVADARLWSVLAGSKVQPLNLSLPLVFS